MALARAFGYPIDEEHINRVYAPMALVMEAAEITAIREQALKLLKGETPLKIRSTSDDNSGSGHSQTVPGPRS